MLRDGKDRDDDHDCDHNEDGKGKGTTVGHEGMTMMITKSV